MFARTERLLLRPSWAEDARELHDAIADERIVRNLARAPWPYGIEDAQAFVAMSHDTRYPRFVLMQRTDGAPRIIGGCGLHEYQDNVELGYWIGRSHWGLGYATEAARALVDIARAIGHRKLTARHFIDNPASGRVLRKAGFRPTGRVEAMHSIGRNGSAPSAVFEQALDGESDGDVLAGKMPVLTGWHSQPDEGPDMPLSIRYIMAARAA